MLTCDVSFKKKIVFVLTTTNTVTRYNILLTWRGEQNKNQRKTMFSAADMPSRVEGGGPAGEIKDDGGRRGRGAKRSLFEWLVYGGVGVQAGGIGVHELGGVMGGHGVHAAVVG